MTQSSSRYEDFILETSEELHDLFSKTERICEFWTGGEENAEQLDDLRDSIHLMIDAHDEMRLMIATRK